MYAHPLFRPVAAAVAVVVLAVALAYGLMPPVGAGIDGAMLALVQRAENAPAAARVVWASAEGNATDAGRLRAELARAVDFLGKAGARAIVLDVPLTEPSDSADLARVRSFLEGTEGSADAAMRARLTAWVAELDHDSELERAIRAAGNVLLLATPGSAPLDRFAAAARGIGVDPTAPPDADGVSRRDRLTTADAAGGAVPSLAFAARLLAAAPNPAAAPLADGPLLAAAAAMRASGGRWVPHYGRRASEQGGTTRVALRELAAGKLPAARFAQQIVVLGDGGAPLAVATGPGLAAGEALAQRIDSLETDSYAVLPRLARLAGVLACLASIAYAGALAPRLGAGAAFGFALLGAIGLVVLELVLLAEARLWLPLSFAALLVPLTTLAAWLMPVPAERVTTRTEPIVQRPAPRPRPAAAPRA
ncbi:MAG: CHASE2 domain-containing protein, partial [Proteobacteria bacterium]|nr:CHASE2 domain-containing protein [Pseudomonadota bacterium]